MILWIAHSLYTKAHQEKLSNAQFRHQAIIRVNMAPAVQGHIYITEGLLHIAVKLQKTWSKSSLKPTAKIPASKGLLLQKQFI